MARKKNKPMPDAPHAMLVDHSLDKLPERVRALETSVEGIHQQLNGISGSLTAIQSSIADGKSTNWPVIISALGLAGMLWAAAIRPLDKEIEKTQRSGDELAKAVLLRDEKISSLKNDLIQLSTDSTIMKGDIRRIYDYGSPITDRRLSLLEYKANIQTPALSPMP